MFLQRSKVIIAYNRSTKNKKICNSQTETVKQSKYRVGLLEIPVINHSSTTGNKILIDGGLGKLVTSLMASTKLG